MNKLIQKLLREGLNEVQSQGQLSPDEQLILDDLVSMNEAIDLNSLIQKFKKHAKTGAITVGIVMSLMSNDALAQEQKQQVMKVAEKTLPSEDVQVIKNQLKQETGLDFNDDYIKNNFVANDKSSSPALPSGDELKQLIIKNGVPGKYIDNVYVDYFGDAQGNQNAGVKISVRLKEEGNFGRLRQDNNKKIIMQRIMKAMKQKAFNNKKGDKLPVSLEVKDPDGGVIGNREVRL